MIRLRSKNLVDYDKMRTIESGADISYIDRGWLVGRGSNYGRTIVDLSSLAIKQGETYYIVADVELVSMGATGVFVSIVLLTNGIVGSIISGKQINNMQLGESQRVVIRCIPDKAVGSTKSILAYNGNSTTESVGWSFKITNLCLFKEDYTIDYEPYWYEPTKIMTRTRNLFVPSYNNNVTIEDNGFVASGWGRAINTHETILKMFQTGKVYTLSFDLEFIGVPPYSYTTQSLGFILYDSDSKQVLVQFNTYINPSQIVKGNKIHMSFVKTMPADLYNAVLFAYSGYCVNADEDNKRYYTTVRFSNIMLTEGSEEVDYVPYMAEVKTLAWGVKPECKFVLDGSEDWTYYGNATSIWIGSLCHVRTNAHELRDAQYNNYWGFQDYGNPNKYLWIQKTAVHIAWLRGSPPFPAWETTDSDGNAIANIPQIKADLAKRNLVVYYDNANVKPKTLAELLKIVMREVYNNFLATVDSDILTLTNSSVENNILILPDDKTVTDNVLNL